MVEQAEKFEMWAVVEVFGHQKFAGKVTEQSIGGCNFVRVDVPGVPESKGRYGDAIGERPPFTKLFGQGAIYSMTPVDESVALAVARSIAAEPMSIYIPAEFKPRPAIEAGSDDDEDDIA